MSQAPTVLIMGPPGAGKGTQASHLVGSYALRHVATGDVLRTAVAEGTELGITARHYMERGDLVPDELIIGLLRELVGSLSAGEGVLLDGFPRTRPQAEALDVMLDELGRGIDVVLDVRVPGDVLVQRLSGRWICRACQTPYNEQSNPPASAGTCDRCGGELYQRDDDRPESVANRLAVYERDTEPVSSYYADKGVLVTIDGNQPLDAVQAALDAAMSRAASA